MDIKTGLSIYSEPWLIEPSAASQMLDLWDSLKAAGKNWNTGATQTRSDSDVPTAYQIQQKFFASSDVAFAPQSSYDMDSFKGFDGASVAVIPISGPMMRNDFCGSFGTNTIKQLVQMAAKTESVKTIVFPFDSPGGTVSGTESLADTIKGCGKRTVAMVTGNMCSAAYWAGSSCDEVYASSKTDIIGSIGTMCALVDNSKEREARGTVIREYYATGSNDKNRAFSEAEKGNGKLLIAEMLDPMNDVFVSTVKENRQGKVKAEALTGKTYTSENAMAVGLIDGIKSLEQIISGNTTTSATVKEKNKTFMKAAEYQAQHPQEAEALIAMGAEREQRRVKAWQAWQKHDPDAVAAGIAGSGYPDACDISEMTAKALSNGALAAMQGANVAVPGTDAPGAAMTEADKFMAEANEALGWK